MARRIWMALALLASALLLNERGGGVGWVQERSTAVDFFDQHGNRLDWGRRDFSGDVERFDTKGNRIGTWERGRGLMRRDRK